MTIQDTGRISEGSLFEVSLNILDWTSWKKNVFVIPTCMCFFLRNQSLSCYIIFSGGYYSYKINMLFTRLLILEYMFGSLSISWQCKLMCIRFGLLTFVACQETTWQQRLKESVDFHSMYRSFSKHSIFKFVNSYVLISPYGCHLLFIRLAFVFEYKQAMFLCSNLENN